MLPYRWMALESVTEHVFTHQSDVWSYGVTLWEIFSLGKVPFGRIANPIVVHMVTNGKRLPQPQLCLTNELFEIMSSCWALRPADRPSFSTLAFRIGTVSLESIYAETDCAQIIKARYDAEDDAFSCDINVDDAGGYDNGSCKSRRSCSNYHDSRQRAESRESCDSRNTSVGARPCADSSVSRHREQGFSVFLGINAASSTREPVEQRNDQDDEEPEEFDSDRALVRPQQVTDAPVIVVNETFDLTEDSGDPQTGHAIDNVQVGLRHSQKLEF